MPLKWPMTGEDRPRNLGERARSRTPPFEENSMNTRRRLLQSLAATGVILNLEPAAAAVRRRQPVSAWAEADRIVARNPPPNNPPRE